MAHIAFESNRFGVVYCKMFSIMTAETAGRIHVPDIVRVCGPRQFLTWENQRLVQRFQVIDRRFNFRGIVFIVRRIILRVIAVERVDDFVGIVETLVRC